MPAKKLSDKELENLVNDLIKKESFRREILEKYGISRATFQKYIKRAIELNYITQEQRDEWLDLASKRTFEGKVRLYGKEKATKLCKDAWKKGVGSNQLLLESAAILGGLATQAFHPHVKDNITKKFKFNSYSHNICDYYNIQFSSQGERFIAVLLLEYELINEIILGENFQRSFGRKKVDFFLEDLDTILEFHPIPKNHSKIEFNTKEEYTRKRKKELKTEGFNGQLITITKSSDFYKSLPRLGIKKDWFTHLEKAGTAKLKIDEYELSKIETE